MSAEQIISFLTRWRRGNGNVLSVAPSPGEKYEAFVAPNGRLIVTIGDLTLGSIFGTSVYKQTETAFGNWLQDFQKEMLYRAEEAVIKDSAQTQRRHSALPTSSHPLRNLERILEASLETGVKPDFVLAAAALWHDRIEDAPEVKYNEKMWLDSLMKGDIPGIARYADELRKIRARAKVSLEKELMGYVPSYIHGASREETRKHIEQAVNLVYDLTRYTDQNPYALSLKHHFSRAGSEPLVHTFSKMILKAVDKKDNNDESDPLAPENLQQLRMAAKNKETISGYKGANEVTYVVGQEFTRMFGHLLQDGVPMSAARRVVNAANNFPGFQYGNRTFNKYSRDVAKGLHGERARELMPLARYCIDGMIASALRLNESGIQIYESDPEILSRKSEIEAHVLFKRGTDYSDKVTDNGFLIPNLRLDAGGKERIDEMDRDPQKRLVFYENALDARESAPRFSTFFDPTANPRVYLANADRYNPRIHHFFTLKNWDAMMKLMPNHGLAVREMRRNTG